MLQRHSYSQHLQQCTALNRTSKVTQHSSKPAKKSGAGHAYVVRFYLIDSSGGEHLAAEGEDQGDAHYLYANQADFPFLYCHNKQDVISWLEGILQSSKLRAGFRTEQVLDRAPSDPATVRLPPFVAYRHEKFEMVDGRHAMKWFLIDQQAQEHLAVTGEEKETRDGHYAYRTAGVFDVVKPLECGLSVPHEKSFVCVRSMVRAGATRLLSPALYSSLLCLRLVLAGAA